jgi:hypothetical protein
MVAMSFTLEDRMSFLAEERSKAYKWYVARVPQAKMSLCPKNVLQEQTWFALERRGV